QDPLSRGLAEQLKKWDGRMAADRIEPLIFSAWLRELTRVLLQPRLGQLFQDYAGFHPDVVHLILTQHPDWCDDPTTSQTETCDEQIARSFDQGVAQLVKVFGLPANAWRWGDAHQAMFFHPLWSKVPIVASRLSARFAADGSTDTVN